MSTEFYNRNWRMPKSSNSSKVSNYSMEFDGGTEYVEISNISSISNVTEFSISAWINSDSVAGSDKEIFTTANSTSEAIVLNLFNGDIIASVGTTSQFNRYNSAVSVGQWYHLTMVFNGSESTNEDRIKLYKNGVLQTPSVTPPTLATTTPNITGNAFIGRWALSNVAHFPGKLDHFAIFDYALSASQITSLYGSSSTGVGNPMAISGGRKPIAYYPIGDYAAFNGSEYLVNNGALQDYVFDFDGTNPDSISFGTGIGDGIGDNYTGGMSISLWFKTSSTGGAEKGLFIFSGGVDAWGEITAYFSFNNLYIRVKGVLVLTHAFTDTTSWHNLLINFLGPAESNQVYLDGTPIGSSFTYTDLDLNGETLTIGYTYSTAYDYQGEMSNFQVWNTNLSGSEITTLYNNGTPYIGTQPQSSNLQGWWKLDASATFDGSNWSIPDSSSNSNTGTSSGMTASNLVQSTLNITTPYSRYALSFDGTDDRVGFTSSIDLGTINTISLWLRNEVSQDRIFLGEDSYAGDYHILGGYNHFILRVGGSFNVLSTGSVPIIPIASNWSHVVFIRNGDEVSLYINGYLSASSSTWSGGSPGSNVSKFDSIGAKPTGGTSWLGKISNASVWNTELSAAQVTEIYNNGLPSNLNNHSAYSNLISWWQLGENSSFDGTNWTALDEKGTLNGTSANMVEDDLVNGVGTTGNGLSDGMGGADNIIGDAPYSTANAVSYGIGIDALSTSVPS